MSDQSKKWKARLLSSSLPLEHEVSKILSQHQFKVSFDYSYSRKDGDTRKEFSIDVHATAFEPFKKTDSINASVVVAAECKFREEGKIWAFLPDSNEPEFSNCTLGGTIQTINHFSRKNIYPESIYEFESKFGFTEKGIEIGLTTGEVFDKDIRHGILQPKYGLPYILKENIEFNIYNHYEYATPFFLVPILITNADLYLFNEEITTESVRNTNDIEEIAKKVHYIIYGSNPGPDFTEHHKNIFRKFNKVRFESSIDKFEDKQKTFKNEWGIYQSPSQKLKDLCKSSKHTLFSHYSQFFICSLSSLDTFITDMQKAVSDSLKKKTNIRSK